MVRPILQPLRTIPIEKSRGGESGRNKKPRRPKTELDLLYERRTPEQLEEILQERLREYRKNPMTASQYLRSSTR